MSAKRKDTKEDSASDKIRLLGIVVEVDHRLPKILLVSGLVIIVLGAMLMTLPFTIAVWEPKSKRLFQEVTEITAGKHYYPGSYYYLPQSPVVRSGNEIRDILVTGNVRALEDEFFDFYILDKLNYERWSAGVAADPLSKADRTKSVSVSLRLTPEQAQGSIFPVVSNRYARAQVEKGLLERTHILYSWEDHNSPLFVFWPSPSVDAVVSGRAEDVDGRIFSLLIMDDYNYARYEARIPYQAFWQGKGRSSYSFSFPLTSKQIEEMPKFVVAREIRDIKQSIRMSAKVSWSEPKAIKVEYDLSVSWLERTYAYANTSFRFGVGLVVLGLALSVVGALTKYIISKK